MFRFFIIVCILQVTLSVPVYYEKDYDEGTVSVPTFGLSYNFGDRIIPLTKTTLTTKEIFANLDENEPVESSKGTFSFADLIDNQPVHTVQINTVPLFSAFNIPWLSQISFHESTSDEQDTLNETTIQISGFDDDFINSNNSSEINTDDVKDDIDNNGANLTIKQRDINENNNGTRLSKHEKINDDADRSSTITTTTPTATSLGLQNSISTTVTIQSTTISSSTTTSSPTIDSSTITTVKSSSTTSSTDKNQSIEANENKKDKVDKEDEDVDDDDLSEESLKDKKARELEKVKKMVKQKIAEISAVPVILSTIV